MINFTVGPVQCSEDTLAIGSEQVPYFRTEEFSAMMKENEKYLCTFFDAPDNSRVVFMTGSGTASMEAGVVNFFDSTDRVLVVSGGSFGMRLAEICQIHEIPFTEITLGFGKPLTPEILDMYERQGYTGFLVQLCETSSGVLFDMNLIGEFCRRNGIFLFVDAVSGFMADEFSMRKMYVNAAITGSQKALALPPSMSFTVMDERAILRAQKVRVKNLYFSYPLYLKNGERGQTPFTPAVATLIMLNERLKYIEKSGGIKTQNEIIRKRAECFRSRIKAFPFDMCVAESDMSSCVTALRPRNLAVSAHTIFEILKDEYGIWVCPNGGEYADIVFRVGHIGAITDRQVDALFCALEHMQERNLI